jgi:hypothetical protein
MRNRRLLRKWARWLLPLLAARAFLPVGFMLTTQAGGLALTFCPDRGAIVQGVDHGAMAHAGHGGHQQHSGHFDPPCPFALAAVAANIDVPQLDTAVVPAAEQFVPKYSVAVPLAGPQRIDRIRGPPSLS